jgi:hypothetical protein
MALSSATVGMRTADFLETFDIVFNLTIGTTQADDSPHFATIYKRHVVQGLGFWGKRDHSRFFVLKPVINPHQRSFRVTVGFDV